MKNIKEMKSIEILNKYQKKRKFNEWKINIMKDFDLMNIQIENEFKIYESSFQIKQLQQLLSNQDSIEEIIKFILYYIDKNEIKIIEIYDAVKFIILSNELNFPNIELKINKKNILCEEIIEKLIKEIQNLKEKNNELELRIKSLENKEKIKEKNFMHKEIFLYNLKKINSINAHSDSIKSVQNFSSGNIISVSKDKSIKIYDSQLNIIQNIQNAHENSITDVSIKDENNFVTCSNDKNIKIWKKKNKEKKEYSLHKIINNAHDEWINKVIYCLNGNIISCSEDKTIKIWEENNNNEYQCIKIFTHNDFVTSILLLEDKNILISSGNDGTKFWDLNNYEEIDCFNEVNCFGVNALKRIDNDRIIVGGNDEKIIKIISINERKIIKEIDNEFLCWGICVIEDKRIFLIGGESNDIKIYNSDNYVCIKTINNAHNNYILGINNVNDDKIISYGVDKNLNVWSFS